ncbi:hypothetical protein CHISP_2147 [Chitinispirillum alkaliphilum]|nr:hypothetical protein CHISP_2147 [Chitinispirillum alkaliphilum]
MLWRDRFLGDGVAFFALVGIDSLGTELLFLLWWGLIPWGRSCFFCFGGDRFLGDGVAFLL